MEGSWRVLVGSLIFSASPFIWNLAIEKFLVAAFLENQVSGSDYGTIFGTWSKLDVAALKKSCVPAICIFTVAS